MPSLLPWSAGSLALWALSVLLALLLGCSLVQSAQAANMTFAPAFSPSQFLGESSTLDAQFTFTGSEYHGSPEPVTEVIVHLPAGVGGSSAGFPTCSEGEAHEGTSSCPVGSIAGPVGSIGLDIEESEPLPGGTTVTKRVPVTGTIQPVFAEPEEGYRDFYFIAEAPGFDFPVRAWYQEDAAPYGRELRLELPLIVDVPGQPYASITSLTLRLGASREENGQLYSSLTIPQECPGSGMFPWATDVTYTTNGSFTEQTHEHLTAETACPASSGKSATTTTLQATPTSPHVGEVVTYTATVTPKTLGAIAPGGSVTFVDEGAPITGCTAQALVPAAASSTASCQVTFPVSGTHYITARYGGDAGDFGSESTVQTITVSAVEPPHEVPKEAPAEIKPPLVVSCCDHPVQPPLITTAQLKALLSRQLVPTGTGASIGALVKNGGYTARFTAPEAGTAVVAWYLVPPGAKLAKHTIAKPVLVASGKLTFSSAGMGKLKVKLTGVGVQLFRHSERMKLTARATFVPRGGGMVSVTKEFGLG